MIKLVVHNVCIHITLCLGVIIFTSGDIFGQSFASRSELKKEIELTDELLNETEESEEESITELLLLSTQIDLREKYLDQLKEDIKDHTQRIGELNLEICQLESDISRIMDEYAETARVAYKGFDTDNFLVSIFSADDVSEAYYRAIYFRQFSQYRKKQVQQLKRTKIYLSKRVDQLEEKVEMKAFLIDEYGNEEKRVAQKKDKKRVVYNRLRPKEKKILKDKEDQKAEIKEKIQSSEDVATPNEDSEPEENQESYAEQFLKSKGHIPWPIPQSQAIITEHFGTSEDPYGNQITNDGIYFRTRKGQKVRAVFTGKVTGVQKLPMEGGYVIIVEHGNYRTVYANLSTSLVKIDQVVTQNQEIGAVKTDQRTGETLLNFLIYKYPDQFDDPEEWIMKK